MTRWLILLTIGAGLAAAQSQVAGTWLGHFNRVPAVRVTLVEQAGKLSGTVLFYLIKHKPDGSEGRVVGDSGAIELRKVVLNKRNRVTFEITGSNGKPKLFEMETVGAKEASLRESGSGAEGMRMVRE